MNTLAIIALSILTTLVLFMAISIASVIYKFKKVFINRLDTELVSLHN